MRKSSVLLGVAGIASAGMLAFNLSALSPQTNDQVSPERISDSAMWSVLDDMDMSLKRNSKARLDVLDAAQDKGDLASACLELKESHDEYLTHSDAFEAATRQRIQDKSIDSNKGRRLLESTLSVRSVFTGVDYRMVEAFCHPRGHNLI